MARSGATEVTRAWPIVAVALGTVLLLDVLRVWQPSVIFIYGRAGSTPAAEMGAFAAMWVIAGLLAAATARVLGPRQLVVLGAGLLAVARLGVPLSGGGDPQLYLASLGWVGAMVWAGGAVAGAPDRRSIGEGLAFGLVIDAATRAALHSVETVWMGGVFGTLAALAIVGAFGVATVRWLRDAGWATRGERTPGPGWPWLALGPLLVLYGVLAGTPARASIAVDLAPGLAAALVVASLTVALAWSQAGGAASGRAGSLAAAGLVLVGTVLALPADGGLAVVGQVLLAVGAGGVLAVLPRAVGSSGPTRRALAAAGALVILFVLGFLYYASYDIALGVENETFLVAAAVVVAGLTVAAGFRAASIVARPTSRFLPVTAVALTALAGLGAWTGSGLTPAEGEGFPIRAVLYNVHMGYDVDGRFDVEAMAEVLLAEGPDIVVLNEVDRGWLLNGSHDVLQLIAEELDLPFVFAPAADEVWGNAILSRYPLSDVETEVLPRGGVPMARSVVSAVATLPDGSELLVAGTHLHHTDDGGGVRTVQAQAVADHAVARATDGRSLLVMGDMNAEPGSDALATFTDAGLVDGVAPLGAPLTFPAWEPDRHIDHVFTSGDLTTSELSVPVSTASDHYAVAVTLTRR